MRKFKSGLFCSLVVAGSLAVSNVAQAQTTTTYGFGTWLQSWPNSYTPPTIPYSFTSPFADLVAVNNGNVWTFTLSVNNNLFSNFGPTAYVSSLNFDFTPTPVPQPTSTWVASNVDGVTTAATFNGYGPSGLAEIDFGTRLGLYRPNALQENDWVTWDVTGLGNSTLTNMYVKVAGAGPNANGWWAKYTPIVPSVPVPEPEAYAMLLAGLGLLGYTVSRKKKTA
jgi:hypothetical protein